MNTSSVVGLQIAKATRLEMRVVDVLDIEAGAGIVGDRYHGSKHRQVSVQSLEELTEAEEIFGAPLDPLLTRRNTAAELLLALLLMFLK